MIAHPCLFLNDHRGEVAKYNIAHHAWAAGIYHQVKLDGDRLAKMELPKFETAWWQEAKNKRWQDIYPENMHHTYYVPRTAIHLAWKSALAYSLSGGEIYAVRARRVLLHYTSYSFEVEHPDVGMNYATWGIDALWTYDVLYDRFTPEERQKLDDFFRRMVEAVARSDEWWIEHNPGGRYNNHYAWHKLMMAAYGLFYGKDEWINRAMDSDQGIRDLIEKGFRDDGIWFESSLNYHFAALTGLLRVADMFRTAGYPMDLYTHKFADSRTLEDGFAGIVQVAFPDTTLPPIGDTYGHLCRLADQPAYEYAWIAYRKPLFAWLLSQKKNKLDAISLFREEDDGSKFKVQGSELPNSQTLNLKPETLNPAEQTLNLEPETLDLKPETLNPPAVGSRTFPEHGHLILRSVEGRKYWNSDSWAAFVSYDLDSIHSHRDKLDFILFGRGKLLAPDCEAIATVEHAFSSKVQRELNRSTVCHNTLMVDGRDHAGIREKLSLLEFRREPGVKTATIADLEGLVYPGVKLQRTVIVADDYVLDVFQAASDEEHAYDWLFHARDDEGKTVLSAGEWENGGKREWEKPPWVWLKNPRTAKLDETWQAEWRQGDVRFRLTMLGVPGTEVTLCDFPKNDTLEPPPTPMLIARRTGKSACFIALYQAEKHDLPPAEISIVEEASRLLVKVFLAGRIREHPVPVLP